MQKQALEESNYELDLDCDTSHRFLWHVVTLCNPDPEQDLIPSGTLPLPEMYMHKKPVTNCHDV